MESCIEQDVSNRVVRRCGNLQGCAASTGMKVSMADQWSAGGASGEVPRILPPALLAPTYQNRLRSIGRDLDVHHFRSIVVLEAPGGFILRAVRRGSRDIELLQYPDDTFPERMILATEARGEGERNESPSVIAPTGYEDLLRAIGRWLDTRRAANAVLTEGRDAMVVTADRTPFNPHALRIETLFDLNAIKQLLDESFRLRGESH